MPDDGSVDSQRRKEHLLVAVIFMLLFRHLITKVEIKVLVLRRTKLETKAGFDHVRFHILHTMSEIYDDASPVLGMCVR